MNKKLLALAVGAAVAMPVVALADGPTIYGKLNLSLENSETGVSKSLASFASSAGYTDGTTVTSVNNNASRVGLKGSADTGIDGVKGLYLAEFGIDADNGASPFTGRNIYAGLSSDYGTVLVGNIDTPLKSAQGSVDEFNDLTMDMKGAVAGELRAPNVVAYASPKIADAITVTVAAWQGEGASGQDSAAQVNGDPLQGFGDALSASVVYEKDGLRLAAAMDQGTPATGLGADLASAVGGTDSYNDIQRFVASYSTDSFEVGGLYQNVQGVDAVPGVGNNYEETSMLISGAYKTGDWKFKAQYVQTNVDDKDALVIDSYDNTMYAIGADYALGKTTTVYGFYGNQTLDGFKGVSGSVDGTVYALGLEQKF